MGDDGRVYRWQVNKQHLEVIAVFPSISLMCFKMLFPLQLVRADIEQPEPPVLIQHKHKRHFLVFRMSRHAWLEVKPELKGTLDSVVCEYSACSLPSSAVRYRLTLPLNTTSKLLADRAEKAACGERARSFVGVSLVYSLLCTVVRVGASLLCLLSSTLTH